jgi:membrane protease subunit HflK
MQKTLDSYGSGIQVHAGADAEGRSAGAGDRRVPRRAGGARRSRAIAERGADLCQPVVPTQRPRRANLQVAEGYKQQAVAEAKGQSARFLKVYDEYKKAPDVTRQRIYLETMERILGNSEKLVYDGGSSSSQSIVPYLPVE